MNLFILLGDYAAAQGRRALRLEVRFDNGAALALYERLGFRQFGQYDNYYADSARALRLEKILATGNAAAVTPQYSCCAAGAPLAPSAAKVKVVAFGAMILLTKRLGGPCSRFILTTGGQARNRSAP